MDDDFFHSIPDWAIYQIQTGITPAMSAEGWHIDVIGDAVSPPASGIIEPNSGLPVELAPDPVSPYKGDYATYAGAAASTLGVVNGIVNGNPYTLGAGAIGLTVTGPTTLSDLSTLLTPPSWTSDGPSFASMAEVGMGNAAGQPLPDGSVIFDYTPTFADMGG